MVIKIIADSMKPANSLNRFFRIVKKCLTLISEGILTQEYPFNVYPVVAPFKLKEVSYLYFICTDLQ